MKAVRVLVCLSVVTSVTALTAAAVSPRRSIHVRVRSSLILSSVEGGLRVMVWTSPEERGRASPPVIRLEPPPQPYQFVRWFKRGGVPGKSWWLMMPMWAVVPVSALPACAVAVRSVVRWQRGKCRKCRYSLVGLPSGSPCPECGHVEGRRVG